ncbi:MAG: hypothetical protein HW389_3242 [Bacteroidetes bacterium]|nr:hypothetical protein [Bacteroidota bacterium]
MRNRLDRKLQPDKMIGSTLIEVKTGTNSVRELQMLLVELTGRIARNPEVYAFALLIDPRITERRLSEVWHDFLSVVRPELTNRLSIVRAKGGKYFGISKDLSSNEQALLSDFVRESSSARKGKVRKGESYYEILKIVTLLWLRREGRVKITNLKKIAGCSYPSVASALKRLDAYIVRHSDRSAELSRFPKDEWARLLANSDSARLTKYFKDVSGQPRSSEQLLKRFQKMQHPGIAVGGVFGARQYYPELDIVGSPRLDLSVHSSAGAGDLSFLESLDPALKETRDRLAAPQLVIHFVRRADSLFHRDPAGEVWADAVECLLDLHEMRMESQARDFLEFLIRNGAGTV